CRRATTGAATLSLPLSGTRAWHACRRIYRDQNLTLRQASARRYCRCVFPCRRHHGLPDDSRTHLVRRCGFDRRVSAICVAWILARAAAASACALTVTEAVENLRVIAVVFVLLVPIL